MIAVTSAVLVVCAVASVTANVSPNTPLYIFRMEQQSSEMNFLPTEVIQFTYITEEGYRVTCDITGPCCGVNPLATSPGSTCNPSCFDTCEDTCPWTCFETCPSTCWNTCPDTCPVTCITCYTCPYTVCTCEVSCGGTCGPTCEPSCGKTCEPICPPIP